MKVKGFVFSGFMSAILMSAVANAASVQPINLASKTYVDEGLQAKQDVLKAGEGIGIDGNVIRSTIDTSIFVAKDEIPGLSTLATDEDLDELKKLLQGEIVKKQDSGDYAMAADLNTLRQAVEALQQGGVDKATLESLKTSVEAISANYANKTELNDVEKRLQDTIDAIDIPSIDGLAEKSYVDAELAGKASATVVQNLQQDIANNYLTKSEVQNTYVTQQEVADTYITQQKAADTYVTSQDVAQQITNVVGTDTTGLKKQVADNVAAIADNKAAIEAIDLASYAKSADVYTKTEVDDKVAEVVAGDMDEALKSYAKAADVEAELAKKADASVLTNYALKAELPVDYVTSGKLAEIQGALQAQIDDKQAKGEYLTADSLADINQAISDLQSGKADASVVKQLQDSVNALDGTYVKDSELQSAIQGVEALITAIKVPTKTSDLDNDSGFITESALTDYATTADVETELAKKANVSVLTDYALKTELPDVTDLATKTELSSYATTADVEAELAKKANASVLTDYALKTELPDVTALATKSELNGYALKSEIPTGFVTEEQLTSLQNTLQAAIDGKQAKGDYAAASDLTKLQEDVAALQAGGSGDGVVDTSALEARIKTIEDTYATDAELTQAISEVRDLIPSTDAFVSNPGDPDSQGAYYLHAQCTASKCRYSWKLVSSIVGGNNGNVGDI